MGTVARCMVPTSHLDFVRLTAQSMATPAPTTPAAAATRTEDRPMSASMTTT